MQVLAADWPELATSIAGVSTMKQTSFALSFRPGHFRSDKNESPFALLLEAPHCSQRLQAQKKARASPSD
jgi:hypothetical protein